MIYGNKLAFLVLLLSFFLIVGCTSHKNFSYKLYDNFEIKSVDNDIKLYKDGEMFKINDLDYQIKSFKFNSDVICLGLDDGNYYMIYYVDSVVIGPHTLESLKKETDSLSMTFDTDFTDITKIEGVIYE